MDDPEMIIFLSENYTQFRQMYEEVYAICQSMEEVIGMYSKELAEADRYNVQYMIDEMQNVIDEQKARLDEQKMQLDKKDKQLDEQKTRLDEQNSQLSEMSEEIKRLKEQLDR